VEESVRVTLLSLTALAIVACTNKDNEDDTVDTSDSGDTGGVAFSAQDTLAKYLSGTFDSSAQAAEDFTYYSVQLQACRVEVPALGDNVLYVEQALMDSLSAPYRQRLYVVEAMDPPETQARSVIYSFGDPDPVIGLCDDPAAVTISPDDVSERTGCAVNMTWMEDRFEGGTEGEGCESAINGASYATSVVTATADRVDSWDQGWNASGTQVWGAVDGPYRFDRQTPIEE